MKVVLRGLTVLAAALTVTLSALPAQASPAPTPAAVDTTVNSCSQAVAENHFTCFAVRRSDLGFRSKARVAAAAQATPNGFGPSSLQAAYALPSSTAGTGQRVYVVDAYDDPNAESDLAAYRAQYGLPACTTANGCFRKLNQNGATSPLPAPNTGWAGEISLDLDMVSAVCPKCGITLVEANDASDNLFVAVKQATTLGAKFVSMSWGGPENGHEAGYDTSYFKSSGVVYTASTGDGAYRSGVSYPATSPRVVAVGGTALKTAGNARGWTETAWKTSTTEGTGSGCSAHEAKPSFQSVVPTATCSRRADSDVSAVADPATGVAVYQTYGGRGWAVYGGTSAAAPIIAAVYALAGTPGSSDVPASYPYAHAGNLNDVTSGTNGTCSSTLLCTAATGWDGPTGLGTPNGVAAFRAGTTSANTVSVTNPGTKASTVGTATSLQISATHSGGAALTYSATGLPVGLSIASGTGRISGTPSTKGTFTVTVTARDSTSASSSASFAWTITATGASTCTGQKLLNPGFESGATTWTASTGVINTNGTYAHTGAGYAWLDGYAKTHTDSIKQAVTIPAGCKATLSYDLWVHSDEGASTAYDRLAVTANGTLVQSYSNVNKGSGYVKRTVNLSAYAGKTVTIAWTGSENASRATSFLIDDAALALG